MTGSHANSLPAITLAKHWWQIGTCISFSSLHSCCHTLLNMQKHSYLACCSHKHCAIVHQLFAQLKLNTLNIFQMAIHTHVHTYIILPMSAGMQAAFQYKLHLWHMTYGMHMHQNVGEFAHFTAILQDSHELQKAQSGSSNWRVCIPRAY